MTTWQNKPFVIDVSGGDTKAFCMCGLSKNSPFCDGSHRTTNITPKVINFEDENTLYICGCQQSSNRPFCDGIHVNLPNDNQNNNGYNLVSTSVMESTKPLKN